MSNVNGSVKTSSSRLADRNIDTTRSPFGIVTPSISTSTFVLRVQKATGVDQRNTSSTALARIDSSARYRSICPGFATNACSPDASAFLVVSLPANAITKKKISSSLAGRDSSSPFSSVITAEVSVLQMSSTGLRRFSAVSSSAYEKILANSSS